MRLIYKRDGNDVAVGDEGKLSDGTKIKVVYFAEPHKPASSGKVTVHPIGWNNLDQEYYVSAIGAEWIEREDQ